MMSPFLIAVYQITWASNRIESLLYFPKFLRCTVRQELTVPVGKLPAWHPGALLHPAGKMKLERNASHAGP
jgi:hypothetical protein